MNVGFGVIWNIIIYNMAYSSDIKATGGDMDGNGNLSAAELAGLEEMASVPYGAGARSVGHTYKAVYNNKQAKKTKIDHINDNHIKFEVSLHFLGIWPTVRRAQ